MRDPIVTDPPDFNMDAAWKDCADHVDGCGGLQTPEGDVNWRAACGADPGVCRCPACKEYHWAWGRRQRCTACSFEYPTDWWASYSYGVQEARRRRLGLPVRESVRAALEKLHAERMADPYYRYGFEHIVDDAVEERDRIDWRAVTEGTP